MLGAMLLLASFVLAARFWPAVKITLRKSFGKRGAGPAAKSAREAASKNTRMLSAAIAALSGAAAYGLFPLPFPFSAALFLGIFLIVSIASGSYESESPKSAPR